jgi:hypothetical protein
MSVGATPVCVQRAPGTDRLSSSADDDLSADEEKEPRWRH